jgi:polyphosphate glucokinase
VFVTGRRRPELDKAVKEIGRNAIAVMSGVSNLSDLDRLYKRHTYEDYVGQRGLERVGKHKWRRHVVDVVARLVAALEPDDVVLGGAT